MDLHGCRQGTIHIFLSTGRLIYGEAHATATGSISSHLLFHTPTVGAVMGTGVEEHTIYQWLFRSLSSADKDALFSKYAAHLKWTCRDANKAPYMFLF